MAERGKLTREEIRDLLKNDDPDTLRQWKIEEVFRSDVPGYPYHVVVQNINYPEGHPKRRCYWLVPNLRGGYFMEDERKEESDGN